MFRLCQACERAGAEVVEPRDDPADPYHLCLPCHTRIHALALRPLEWYNLAKRHGWWLFLLHDDFYEDDGTAMQPREDVERPEEFPAPTLSSVRLDPALLLDYSISKWCLAADLTSAWKALPGADVLASLSARFAARANVGIRGTILAICAAVLDQQAADFVRYAWGDYPDHVSLASLADAAASCLPHAEGIVRVKTALSVLEGRQKRDLMWTLGYFHTPDALDWIEQNICEPITESWGYLAAASTIDWPRIERWFNHGRPLSLVAIDALAAIARPMSPFLRQYGPMLGTPPKLARFRELLLAYCTRDPVPRVQRRIEMVLANAEKLTATA